MDPGAFERPSGDRDDVWEFSLYVLGQSTKSVNAEANLRKFCSDHLDGRSVIEVIDLAITPSLARTNNIIAIPTLIRRSPKPERRFIGDLSSTDGLRKDLGRNNDNS